MHVRRFRKNPILASLFCPRSRRGVTAALLMLATAACHNTAQGVKADTQRALDKTGKALERAGDKIDGHRKKDR
jgi:predicted small secreted protein